MLWGAFCIVTCRTRALGCAVTSRDLMPVESLALLLTALGVVPCLWSKTSEATLSWRDHMNSACFQCPMYNAHFLNIRHHNSESKQKGFYLPTSLFKILLQELMKSSDIKQSRGCILCRALSDTYFTNSAIRMAFLNKTAKWKKT